MQTLSPSSSRNRQLLALLCLAVATVIVYLPSLGAPWYFDDYPGIVYNEQSQSIVYILQHLWTPRAPALLSFALNSAIFGLQPGSFHAVNLIIHLLTCGVVYLCLKRVFANSYWTLCATAIFALHPLQTQAVSYIVQRSTSLSALFLFSALYFYARACDARTEGHQFHDREHLSPYLLCLGCGILAIMTKQNAATLPLLLILFERFFLPGNNDFSLKTLAHKLLYLSPLLLPTVLYATSMLLMPLLGGEEWRNVSSFVALRVGETTTPATYLWTEFSVFWLYFRLLLLPIHQVLDYGYPITQSLLGLKPLLSLGGLLALWGAAFAVRKKVPELLFFLFWFFTALLVESSVIPLDPAFEHRLYVPMFGFAILVCTLLKRLQTRPYLVAGLALVMVSTLAILSYGRNQDWADPLRFYTQDVQYGNSYRSQIMLADQLYSHGDRQASRQAYDRVVDQIEQAGLKRADDQMLVNIAIAYGRFGDYPKAEKLLRMALKKHPKSPGGRYNLGIALYLQQRPVEALREFKIAYELMPSDPNALYYYLLLSAELHRPADYDSLLGKLQQLNPQNAATLRQQLQKLGNIH